MLLPQTVTVLILGTTLSALYDKSSGVTILTHSQFQNQLKAGDDFGLVEFFSEDCSHCKSLAPIIEQAALALKGVVPVFAISDSRASAEENVNKYPTIRWYEKGVALNYEQARTVDSIVDFSLKRVQRLVRQRLKGSDSKAPSGKKASSSSPDSRGLIPGTVTSLTSRNFGTEVMNDEESAWFVKFYAPWCGHCKAIERTWHDLAKKLGKKVRVGDVDATTETELATRFRVQGYPTLIMFPAGPKSVSKATVYQGERELGAMVQFALKSAGQSLKAKQLLSRAQLKEECEEELCMISFLPHILDSTAKERKEYIRILNSIIADGVELPVKYFWIEASNSLAFERSLRLEFGWPAVIMTAWQKGYFATHRGGYNKKALTEFLLGATSGRIPGDALPVGFDELFKEVRLTNHGSWTNEMKSSPWDGRDAKKPIQQPADEEL